MKKLSTGKDSTLGNWIEMSAAVFGEDSEATKFLAIKVEVVNKGLDEEVIANEYQLIMVLFELDRK